MILLLELEVAVLDQQAQVRLLALDQASVTTGWSVFVDKELIEFGKFTLQGELDERLVAIRQKVTELIDKYEINYVAFENIQMQNSVGNNVQTFKTLAEILGNIRELVKEKNLPYQVVTASTWKSYSKIKGRKRAEQKKNAQLYVIEKFNIKPTQDEADAICIGLYASNHLNGQEDNDEGYDWS